MTKISWTRPAFLATTALLGAFVLALPTPARSGPRAPKPQPRAPESIDTLAAKGMAAKGFKPAALCTDEEFLRRVYLDVAGAIPTSEEALAFIQDKGAGKRVRLIDKLLAGKAYPRHFASVWRNLIAQKSTGPRKRQMAPILEDWFARRFAANTPYDRMVRQLLTATGSSEKNAAIAFLAANSFNAKDLTTTTTSVFMGTQLQCARCHNAPYDKWKQTDYYGMAAFFSRIGRKRIRREKGKLPVFQIFERPRGEIVLDRDGKKAVVPPTYLGGKQAPGGKGNNRRQLLAQWLTAKDNPYFARALANRLWAQLLGRGLIDPPDDIKAKSPNANPELLAFLTREVTRNGYDIKKMVRLITSSRTYQASSRGKKADPRAVKFLARHRVRPMTGEQLFRSTLRATRFKRRLPPKLRRDPKALRRMEYRRMREFAKTFGDLAASGKYEPTISQALLMMNGRLMSVGTAARKGSPIRAMIVARMADKEIVAELYLSTLSRLPTKDEMAEAKKYILKAKTRRAGLEDLFWALLNSTEFLMIP